MKKSSPIQYVVLAIFLVIIAAIMYPAIRVAPEVEKIDKADHKRMLAECRDMLNNKEEYKKNDIVTDYVSQPYIYIDNYYRMINLPSYIKSLEPNSITLHGDRAHLDFDVVGKRMSVLAFKEGASEYGTKKYIDGLWYWDGNVAKE